MIQKGPIKYPKQFQRENYGNRQLGTPRHRCKNSVKMYLKIMCADMEWIHLAQYTTYWYGEGKVKVVPVQAMKASRGSRT